MKLDRRYFLRGALGGVSVSLALPTLERFFNSHGTAYADGTTPIRFGQWFWGGGTGDRHESFYPSNTGNLGTLTGQLSPLNPYKNKLSVISGMGHSSPPKGNISHGGNMCLVLSGYFAKGIPDLYNSPDRKGGTDLPSIDQRMASALQVSEAEHLKLRISDSGIGHSGKTSFHGLGNYNSMPRNPQVIYDTLFGGSPGTGGGTAQSLGPQIRSRRSVMDAVRGDLRTLRPELSQSEKLRLDTHIDAVEKIESRLAVQEQELSEIGVEPPPAQCGTAAPTLSSYSDANLSEHNRVMADLLAVGISCGLTRVFAYEFTSTQCQTRFLELGINKTHHTEITHGGTSGKEDFLPPITKFTMEQLAYLAGRLDAIPEGAGTVLDNTLIFATSELLVSESHQTTHTPAILLGGAGGRLKTGIHHRDSGGNFNKIALTAYKAMGTNIASVGKGPWETSSAIEALLV